ncbi:nicotinate-nucleotide adenylyltransferase [Halomonas urumqiensis]|uniref:Probable nicotinate-nucleotide adenylyltransferase n=1 Tax=Halomonas urumqiensis TaxID=1684789 RepID=A0A2N7UFX6_9GAMM|nr:nicotinate-nucleotide adenylyltransferase [Halomonas urumqiensis]PMR79321.1 nicotinate-nicotinamide nucleotide adenylyltransferase [Halomonas urumqiensis]PTB04337.1 nicotinate-nucleotide adenylyltransferase [Halomonas urumqiensis]
MFGGTFDPVHLGHLRSAVELHEALALDRVHMIPAAAPPLRGKPQVSADQRLELLRLGIGDTPGLVADPRELSRSGPSYSADTLATLREEYGREARIVMVLGFDAFLRLAEWRDPGRLFALAHLVVIDRPDHLAELPSPLVELLTGREVATSQELMRKPAGHLLRLSLPSRMAISATEVRCRLAGGASVRYLLPEAVEAHALAHGLYRD